MFLLSMRLLKEVTLYMDEKKKKFIAPEANMLDFANDDILTTSGDGGEWWMGGGDNAEPFGE